MYKIFIVYLVFNNPSPTATVYGCNETIIHAYSLQFDNSTAVNYIKSVSYIVHSFREKH